MLSVENDRSRLILADCLDALREMPDSSIDSIVTDPPYGLSFMGKRWDYDVPSVEIWAECLRVLKPGGHLLAFAGTRTQHRMAVRIEDAGFEIRDMIAWVYGSGFPKSLDVSKAIDKAGGASPVEQSAMLRTRREAARLTREQVAEVVGCTSSSVRDWEEGRARSAGAPVEFIVPSEEYRAKLADLLGYSADERRLIGATGDRREDGTVYGIGHSGELRSGGHTEAAQQWQGWGTALKPALETVTFASKPYTQEQERDIILSNLIRLEARLWLLSSANAVGKSSTSSQSEYGAACAIAQWSAEEITSTRAALCGQMDMSPFELATTTSLNIVSSWRRTLDESWSDGSTSTTETKLSTTIDWRTLKFSLSQITPAGIIKACSLPGGFSVNASTAESHFNASLSLLQSIRTLSATELAISQAQHEHLGAGVKPSLDPCIMARKPLIGTVAANVLAHGTGALNIDGCRVDATGDAQLAEKFASVQNAGRRENSVYGSDSRDRAGAAPHPAGRFPANLIHDGSDEVVALFPDSGGSGGSVPNVKITGYGNGIGTGKSEYSGGERTKHNAGSGSAARFFYCAKASRKDREDGNNHPTVKPTELMRYLCRLVTPPGGAVLDPYMGSGSTGKAAMLEGFRFIGIEKERESFDIATARIKRAQEGAAAETSPQSDLFATEQVA